MESNSACRRIDGPVTIGPASVLIVVFAWGMSYGAQDFELNVVSSRPDSVSGGNVLVQLRVASGSHWSALLDGRDVTELFHPVGQADNFLALLEDLKRGANTLEIQADGRRGSKIELIDHPLTGPIFSGPHQEPFICQTVANGLGPAKDSSCSAKTIVQYYYKTTEPTPAFPLREIMAELDATPGSFSPGFKAYDPSGPLPTDVARTVTSDGQDVPYIVRREIGTINRAVYEIQFLHKPGDPLPTAWTTPTPGWNGRLMYVFGGGCAAGYRQGTLGLLGRPQEPLLARGYAVATSTLNIFGNDCNDRISAETLSMVKEHFIKEYGKPVHTIGMGESGGGMQVYLIAQNYPGLLDAIVPIKAFPDVTTFVQYGADCLLLDNEFESSGLRWTAAQKTAVSGLSAWRTCAAFRVYRSVYMDPRNCNGALPKGMIYDPTINPRGARCDVFSNEINVFGRDPRTGRARRPFDNVGVQYGLAAFNNGKIDVDQFVELNQRIGGFDEDGKFSSIRTQAHKETLRFAYGRGLVLTGRGGLSAIPIIDWRPYGDELPIIDGHPRVFSFVTRARLTEGNGNADNQVIVVGSRDAWFDSQSDAPWAPSDFILRLDRWLDNMAADRAVGTPVEKVVRNRPTDLEDSCISVDGERITDRAIYGGQGKCDKLYPSYSNPRLAAGVPLADSIVKCQLKPISPGDYSQPLGREQIERLKAIFPSGVCDYSRPGVGQDVALTAWQSF
jgi:hypothetical protein